ncbi:MAG: response regulator transcription factor [Bacteroidetes bacterium]|nr:response regulator transcription factor [Bacteroidota bacterium]
MNESGASLLIVEDDPHMGMLLQENLKMAGFRTILAKDGMEGISKYREGDFDLCLLDIMLPKKDGMEVAEDIRVINPQMPFIFITARTMSVDRIKGFKVGCDDYITKPFELEELILRVKAVLNRTHGPIHQGIEQMMLGKFEFNLTERLLSLKNKVITLSTKEAQLLWLLAINSNEAVSRHDMLRHVWGTDNYFVSKSMDVYLTKVRKYLKSDPNITLKNIHGYGYKLEVV